ncbi:MAG: hypothetical protein ACXVP0_18780 [Bacteroidia bacterium]
MPIQFHTFDQQKIDRHKNHLDAMAANGKPQAYEVYVDALKVIPKTEDPAEFENYEDYMTPGTDTIKIVIYGSSQSPRNEKYVYSLKAKTPEEALDMGLSGIAFKSFTTKELALLKQDKDRKTLEQQEIEHLNSEIGELKAELAEKQQYVETLETAVEQAKANGNKIGGAHIGDILSVALEGILRRNTHIIAQIPALNGIADIINKDNASPMAAQQPDAEASFQRKAPAESAPALTVQEKEFLALYHEIQRHFTQEEFAQVIELIEELTRDKSKIAPALELLRDTQ